MFYLNKTMIFMILMGSDFGGFKSVSGEFSNQSRAAKAPPKDTFQVS